MAAVVVMAVVVPVRMVVGKDRVLMVVFVGQVQVDADSHEHRAVGGCHAARWLAERGRRQSSGRAPAGRSWCRTLLSSTYSVVMVQPRCAATQRSSSSWSLMSRPWRGVLTQV